MAGGARLDARNKQGQTALERVLDEIPRQQNPTMRATMEAVADALRAGEAAQ